MPVGDFFWGGYLHSHPVGMGGVKRGARSVSLREPAFLRGGS